MTGWIYLIRNGGLYKIGITKNINNRMRQLKPDEVLVKSYISNYRELEKDLHYRYKKVRIPQTEYFRLSIFEIRECKRRILYNKYSNYLFKLCITSLLSVFIVFLLFICLNIYIFSNWRLVISNSINGTEKVTYLFMLISCITTSGEKFNFIHEFRFRILKVTIYLIFNICLNMISQVLQNYSII